MPFRAAFDCLWCGVHHEVRSDSDLEGWASLCSECVGRASDNGFLRARLRAALAERSAAAAPTANPAAEPAAPAMLPPPLSPTELSASYDDWYLRRGRFSAGPIVDQPWQMELDEATRWLDALPLTGTIIELAAGTGWWSPLLADKGELWLFEADEAALDQARQRLVAHGLLAHLHLRGPLAPPERRADAVFCAYLLGAAADEHELLARLGVVHGWLRPGGRLAFIDAAAPTAAGPSPIAGPRGPLWPRSIEALTTALLAAGFERPDISITHSAFTMGTATVPGST